MKLQGTFVNDYGQARRNIFSQAREQRGDWWRRCLNRPVKIGKIR